MKSMTLIDPLRINLAVINSDKHDSVNLSIESTKLSTTIRSSKIAQRRKLIENLNENYTHHLIDYSEAWN